MIDTIKVAIRASTQEHLEIEDIQEGIVILKDGGACLVIAVSSINFDLLSEAEQEATIFAYAALINSLNFPIQIVVRSQQKDISSYLSLLKETAEKKSSKLFKSQIQKYHDFVRETVQKNNVLDKKFYLVIPMSPLEIGATKVLAASMNVKKRKLPFTKDYILEQAKINLHPRRDHLLRQLARLGIRGHQLESKDLIKLFFEIYNSAHQGQQTVDTSQYQVPLVQSTIVPPASTPPQTAPDANEVRAVSEPSPEASPPAPNPAQAAPQPEPLKPAQPQPQTGLSGSAFGQIDNLVSQSTNEND